MKKALKVDLKRLHFSGKEEFDLDKIWTPAPPPSLIEQRRVYKFPSDPDCLLVYIMRRLFKYKYVKAEFIWESGFLATQNLLHQQMAFVEYNAKFKILFVNVRVPKYCNYNSKGGMLLRNIVESIETNLEFYFPLVRDKVQRLIPCNHCLMKRITMEPYYYSYEECIDAVTSGYPVVYCNLKAPPRCVSLEQLAPDITFIDFPTIKEYEIVIGNEIGEGSFGTVYKGTWKNKKVAIKSIKINSSDSEKTCKFWDFQQESYIMSKLDHENLVYLYGVISTPPMMVMEYINGGDLYNLIHPIDQNDPLKRNRLTISIDKYSWKLRLKIALDIAKGMEYLQNINPSIIHRDLRSPNIFIVSLNEKDPVNAKVADFGLARMCISDKAAGSLNSWQWLPPEIIVDDGGEYGLSVDVYSFGVILWELITVRYPYDEYENEERFIRHVVDGNGNDIKILNIAEVKKAIIEERLRPSIPSNCPPRLRNLIEECWQHSPRKRPSFTYIVQNLSKELRVHISTPDKFHKRKIPVDDYEC